MSRLRPRMGETRFVTTVVKGADVATEWHDRTASVTSRAG